MMNNFTSYTEQTMAAPWVGPRHAYMTSDFNAPKPPTQIWQSIVKTTEYTPLDYNNLNDIRYLYNVDSSSLSHRDRWNLVAARGRHSIFMNERSYRGGAQVHAVPDDERALDASGRPLPWGYAYADSANLSRKQPVERGPFGKTTSRRSASRSKTTTPATKEEILRLENHRVQDEIFGRFKAEQEHSQALTKTTSSNALRDRDSTAVTRMHSANDLTTVAPTTASATTTTQTPTFHEPTPILIHGFLPSHQPPSIHFYENVSRGIIYEDYDRSPIPLGFAAPCNAGMTLLSATTARTRTPKTLPPEALRKINSYEGGEHWIRVTLDSPEAARRACEASPHVIGGCEVYCVLWNGRAPSEDVAIHAGTKRGAGTIGGGGVTGRSGSSGPRSGGRDFFSLPGQRRGGGGGRDVFSDGHGNDEDDRAATDTTPRRAITSGNDSLSPSSATASGSGTATMNDNSPASSSSTATLTHRDGTQQRDIQDLHSHDQQQQSTTTATSSRRQPRLRNAVLLPLRPASEAFLPTVPWSVRTFGHVPLLGSLVQSSSGHSLPPSSQNPLGAAGGQAQSAGLSGSASGSEVIPRLESGQVDWKVAGWWWIVCWWLDWVFGSDLCGLRDE